MDKQQIIEEMVGHYNEAEGPVSNGMLHAFNGVIQPHFEAQQREIERLREALEEIAGHGVSQSPAMNMPEEQWAWRCFNNLQWIAKQALAGEGECNG